MGPRRTVFRRQKEPIVRYFSDDHFGPKNAREGICPGSGRSIMSWHFEFGKTLFAKPFRHKALLQSDWSRWCPWEVCGPRFPRPVLQLSSSWAAKGCTDEEFPSEIRTFVFVHFTFCLHWPLRLCTVFGLGQTFRTSPHSLLRSVSLPQLRPVRPATSPGLIGPASGTEWGSWWCWRWFPVGEGEVIGQWSLIKWE